MNCTADIEIEYDAITATLKTADTEFVFRDMTQVVIRNTRYGCGVAISVGRWYALCVGTLEVGKVNLDRWFPRELYGNFADGFTEDGRLALESYILDAAA